MLYIILCYIILWPDLSLSPKLLKKREGFLRIDNRKIRLSFKGFKEEERKMLTNFLRKFLNVDICDNGLDMVFYKDLEKIKDYISDIEFRNEVKRIF